MPTDVVYPGLPRAPDGAAAVPAIKKRRYASAVVWAVFAVCLIGAAAYIAYAGHDISRYDDGGVLLHLAQRPISWKWLWSIHAGAHRLPLVRLIVWAVTKVCANNFTAMLWGNLFCMAALSAAALRVLARLKGRLEMTDAVLPLLLLGLGQFFTWTFDFQFQFVASTLLLGCVALLALQAREPRGVAAFLPAALIPLLVLCGANGLLTAAPLAAWLVLDAFVLWRSGGKDCRRLALAQAGGAVFTAGILCYYFRGWKVSNFGHAIHPAVGPMARTACQMMAIGFGTGVTKHWPWFALLVMAGLIFVTAALGWQLVKKGWSRARSAQLACIAAALAVCIGVGLGRSRVAGGGTGLQSRYVTLGLCLPLVIFLAAQLTGREVRRIVGGLFLFMALAVLWGNFRAAQASARSFNANAARLHRALRAGESLPQLSRETFSKQIFGWKVSPYLPVMYATHIGPFRNRGVALHMRMPVPIRPVRMNPSRPAFTRGVTRKAAAWRVTAASGGLTYRLQKPAYALGLRVRYVLQYPRHARARGTIAFWWSARRAANLQPQYDNNPYFRAPPGSRTITRTVWIFGMVGQFHININCPGAVFHLVSMELLKPRTLPNLRAMARNVLEKSASVGVFPGKMAGTFMFFAPAECRTCLPAPAGRSVLHIEYGLLPRAWTGKIKSAGVLFRVWAGRGVKKKLLWSDFDDPVKNPADRSPLSASIPVPADISRTIVFQTTRGITPNDDCDWSYWSQALFTGALSH